MPTGHVFRWHLRIMMQPSTTSGAVAKPNSSAPSNAPIDDVAAGLHLAVDLHGDAAAQPVQHERLLRLGEAQLPRRARVLDRRLAATRRCRRRGRRSSRDRPSPWPHPRRRCRRRLPDTSFTRDRRLRIRVLEIVDQLRQILDRVDVVVRRRRDQADARHRIAQLRDVLGHLVARAAGRLRRASRPAPS